MRLLNEARLVNYFLAWLSWIFVDIGDIGKNEVLDLDSSFGSFECSLVRTRNKGEASFSATSLCGIFSINMDRGFTREDTISISSGTLEMDPFIIPIRVTSLNNNLLNVAILLSQTVEFNGGLIQCKINSDELSSVRIPQL